MYLNIVFECKGTIFGVQLRDASEKAHRLMADLSGLMPNVGGPREGRRRLLVSVVQSILPYDTSTRVTSVTHDRWSVAVFAMVH